MTSINNNDNQKIIINRACYNESSLYQNFTFKNVQDSNFSIRKYYQKKYGNISLDMLTNNLSIFFQSQNGLKCKSLS